MNARSLARELAVIVISQLPKEQEKLKDTDFNILIARAVRILCDYARQNLTEAEAILAKSAASINDLEIDHPKNASHITELEPVPVTTADLKAQLTELERAHNLTLEALDLPEIAMTGANVVITVNCSKCDHSNEILIEKPKEDDVQNFLKKLLDTHLERRSEVNEIMKNLKTKWKPERMVNIDRDILRIATTELFFMPEVPINVVVSEAVELAHRFADERAAKFINGVLSDLIEDAVKSRKGEAVLLDQ